jgi:ferritin-like metal-binding protein YciE
MSWHGVCGRELRLTTVQPSIQNSTTMITTLKELYYDQLRDIYSAETQLLTAIPKLCDAATCNDLREALSSHLEETREQVARLMKICKAHNISPEGETCAAMKGLIKEGDAHVANTLAGDVRDAVIIASANRVEHYEIAAYGVAKAFAGVLDFSDDVSLLDDSLDEESNADKAITKIATGGLFASGVNAGAAA